MILAIVAALGLTPAVASARRDKDCSDFPSQRAAQFFFLEHGGPRYDPDRLDADHDGIACEDNPAPYYFKRHLP
ncbi:MAG TPA: excalibur calcium-binding domain-containing protein [Solirubrobacterales bacterium]|nr:excalibur calcium-binding domain-containing protein [Solirubrobacterales bacterium]